MDSSGKGKELYIGIMSGTSMDGVDLVLADFSGALPKVVAALGEPWPGDMLPIMHRLCAPGADELDTAGGLAVRISQVFAGGVTKLLNQAGIAPEEVTAIGSHGQTVRHRPGAGFSVQLGSGALLAELTGIDVICDFRAADLAAGGQGAPLVPAFHSAVFRDPAKLRIIINIGGIANISVLDHALPEVPGFDTGPGNTLMDHTVRRIWNEPWDRDALHARQGQIRQDLLSRLLEHPYLAQPFPKSTGRETFSPAWLEEVLATVSPAPAPEDLLRTLCAFTAETIGRAADQTAGGQEYEAYVCGGGAHNPLLMEELGRTMQGCVRLADTWALGADPDYVEALAFAWLAMRFTRRLPGNLPSATGARRERILGCLYPR